MANVTGAKSSGIPADYFPHRNPQETWEFLVVCWIFSSVHMLHYQNKKCI